jgi:hypothetical protein
VVARLEIHRPSPTTPTDQFYRAGPQRLGRNQVSRLCAAQDEGPMRDLAHDHHTPALGAEPLDVEEGLRR